MLRFVVMCLHPVSDPKFFGGGTYPLCIFLVHSYLKTICKDRVPSDGHR